MSVYGHRSECLVPSLPVSVCSWWSHETPSLALLILIPSSLMIHPGLRGRPSSFQLSLTDCLDVFQGHIIPLFYKVKKKRKKKTSAEQSACIWTPAESINGVCCEITLTQTCTQLAPESSALKWSSAVWWANSGWRGCLRGKRLILGFSAGIQQISFMFHFSWFVSGVRLP